MNDATTIAPGDRLIDLKEVRARTSLSTATIYRRRGKTFPRSYAISDSRVAWLLSDIERWIQERVSSSP
ncbi:MULTISPECIES: helix-turn-helix transcriptional regulator [unclassified Sphingobium]|uniref:helix-turn-helix transcriptional regulator n=1 Tax=unclassified Sphingobium TaxID=2611147 RepID=UPI0035A5F55F